MNNKTNDSILNEIDEIMQALNNEADVLELVNVVYYKNGTQHIEKTQRYLLNMRKAYLSSIGAIIALIYDEKRNVIYRA